MRVSGTFLLFRTRSDTMLKPNNRMFCGFYDEFYDELIGIHNI